jgi:NAD+ synthase (glutamine-hydrolysing)
MPLRVNHVLFNCAVVVAAGRILGAVPKSFLPNYGEFYEMRQFNPAENTAVTEIGLLGQQVPFGPDQLFELEDRPLFRFHVEICEDVWVPVPPSSFAALAGATVLVNLSASNVVVGKSGYRHQLVGQQSARCLAAYLYSSAGLGESTTDMAWDGQSLIYEKGDMLAQSERFLDDSHIIFGDVDLERLSTERMHATTFAQSVRRHAGEVAKFRINRFTLALPLEGELPLRRTVERFPYVPADGRRRDERCTEVYNIQVQALLQRLQASGHQKVVIGISGGLDSTHALAGLRQGHGPPRPAAHQHPGLYHARLRDQRAHAAAGARTDARGRLHGPRDRHPPELHPDAEGPRPSVCGRQARNTTSPSRTCRPASAPAICSGWRTTITAS